MQTYKDLLVWQKSINLISNIYKITQKYPKEERYGLVSQMRRSAISISSNITEGFCRKNSKENAQFVNIAYASANELDTQIIISKNLNIVQEKEFEEIEIQLIELLKMLYKYREYLYKYKRSVKY